MSVTIKYALTRTEVVRGYFGSLRNSPKYLAVILLYASAMAILFLAGTGAFSRPLTPGDAIVAVAIVVCFIPFLSIWLFIRAKTSIRSLTVSPDGISSQIGKLQAQLPWRKIKIISVTDRSILMARANGNAFFIPNRAFSSTQEKTEFANNIQDWANAPEPV
jgi:hypothetical protein